MSCARSCVSMPTIRWRVVCGFFDVMLTFSPISAFMSVDLPTLGRPTMATCPQRYGSASTAVPSLDLLERRFGGCLLGGPTADAAPGRHQLHRADAALDVEHLRMRLPGGRDDRILRHAHASCL